VARSCGAASCGVRGTRAGQPARQAAALEGRIRPGARQPAGRKEQAASALTAETDLSSLLQRPAEPAGAGDARVLGGGGERWT